MNVCRWCTPSGLDATEYLRKYASKQLSPEDLEGSNDDLCYCLECVVEYHKAREKLPSLHQILLELETSRLIAHIEKSMREEAGEDDELFIVDENGETQLPVYVGPDFENNLRVPLLEVLKYPYLLLHEKVSELCVEVLCRMEESHTPFQVFEKYPGIYLFLVHPNEVIRRWAILTAKNLGKVDRDDYYDLQEVLTCLFKVIELGLFESPDIYRSSVIEKGKLILLPSHLYDTTNYKNYWLGICMLLTVLEEQAMDSLLLGPDKQNDFMQSILHIMEKEADDDSTDPFWPALHCFMVILDQLGSKVWGQLIDPVQAFQTIINSDTGWKTAICPDYCPNMYEDMQTLANVLQSDIGRDMRVHHSTFLWFIPFVQSLMDLKDLGVAYIVEVIHYLCSEIKDILNERIQRCDKVSEFFLLILVSIIELHRNKKCLHLLWISSQEWVEAVVRCAKLPAIAFTRCTEKAAGSHARGSSAMSSQASNSVQHSCVQLIRSLLREGYQIGQHALCKQYLDKLNLLLRGNLSLGWQLNIQETQELQMCLKQVVRSLKSRALNTSVSVENSATSTTLPTVAVKQEKSTPGDGYKMSVHGRGNLCSPFAFTSMEGEDERCQENCFTGRNSAWEENCKDSSKNAKSLTSTDCLLVNIKKEPDDVTTQECKCPQKSFAKDMYGKVQENRNSDLMSGNCDTSNQYFTSIQSSSFRRSGLLENKQETEAISPVYLSAQTSVDSPEHVYSSDVKERNVSPSSSSEFKKDAHKLFQTHSTECQSRLVPQIADLKSCSLARSASEVEQPMFCAGGSCMRKDCCKHQGISTVGKNEDRESADPSRSSETTWEKSAFQSRLLSTKQEPKNTPLDCFSFFKNQAGFAGGKDNSILFSGVNDALLQNVSTRDDSSSLSKSVCLKDRNMKTLDQGWPNVSDLAKCDCKGQISKTSCTVKHSVSGHTPSSSENKGDISSTALPANPLTIKCESSEKLIVCSKYFKRENSSEGKEDEDFVRMASGDNTLTNSEIDKDISKLSLAAYVKSVNFPSESSEESSMHHNTCDVKRKVRSAVRSSSNAQSNQLVCDDTDCHGNKVIIILDSSDEENGVTINEETKEINENVRPENQPSSEIQHDVVDSKLESKMPNSPLPLEDCGSQYFEFETEDDVFSVWQDTQEYKQDCDSTSVDSRHSDGLLKDHTNEWGYDTDHINDDPVEKETDWIGEPIDNTSHQKEADNPEVTNSTLQEFSAKENAKDELEKATDESTADKDLIRNAKMAEPRASTSDVSLASKLALKKSSLSPRKSIAKSKVARAVQRSPKTNALNTTQTKKLLQSTLKKIQPIRTMPAVVPPKKARQCPAPTSTVEKLGLKKAPRKAFELSQRSLDSLAQLRSYGKVAGKVVTAQKRKYKQIAHPSLSTQISKKKLACQELQFLKQTRLSKSVQVKNILRSSEDGSKKVSTAVDTKSVKQKVVGNDKGKAEGGSVVQAEHGMTTSKENEWKPDENSDDDDNLFLTQLDPVDMELCSQEENTEDNIASTGAEKMEIDSTESLKQNEPLSVVESFSKDLEDVEKQPPASKSRASIAKPAVLRPLSEKAIPARNQTWPVRAERCSSFLGAKQPDHNIFVTEVLKWTYEMFANSTQFGPPNSLLQSVVASVPIRFQGYNDYFNTFFPLMMLNAFETLAQEWIENQKMKEKSYNFQLQNFCADLNTAEFTAYFQESDLTKQLHPKEDDLIFLVVRKKSDAFGEDSDVENHLVNHVGLVRRFSRASGCLTRQKEQYTVCHLSVQTRGNLSFFINNEVKCVVIGSLVPTQRSFKGLLLLSRSPLAKPIINPSYSDFCPRDLPVASESATFCTNEYNEDQKRAIETAYAMVKQHPGLAKICLIHGPPGTGKSKTIVGLLSRVLRENTRNEKTSKKNARIKQNRFLVCAPSNAAVDELMKKIIIAFKEKCQNRQEPLGNCGDIKLVRLGAERSINSEVRAFSLDKQVEHRMKRKPTDRDLDIQKKKAALDQKLDMLSRQRAMHRCEKREVIN
ncbi:hypothetical protein ASZ78_009559 [Callipepla squamata]|uniref:DNA2/NAM7 helicase helicase domain-containing protein n=1 Tax=Callipepla squamata TaxID=9009 RepID=A0A226NMU5_CALSU|nr:hypothetical protein ASZ78_009559 [Callipepla squamata]